MGLILGIIAAVATLAIVERLAGLYIETQDNLILSKIAVTTDRTASEFKKHERKWRQHTLHISSPIDKYLHPSYARIIGLGWPAVAYILKSLQQRPSDWFYALRAITGENPVPAAAAGDVRRMANIWIRWGQKRSLIFAIAWKAFALVASLVFVVVFLVMSLNYLGSTI